MKEERKGGRGIMDRWVFEGEEQLKLEGVASPLFKPRFTIGLSRTIQSVVTGTQ